MLLALLACTPASKTCDVVAPDPGRLRTDGTTIRDANGRQIILRGVNAGGRSKFAPYLPFDVGDDFDASLAAYLDRAQAWGFDVLRVPFVWAAMEPERGHDDEEWLARYDALLDAAWARGMWTIVDAHQDIYSEVYCGDGFPAWTVSDPPAPHHDCADWFYGYLTGDDDVDAAFDAFWDDRTGVRTDFGAMWERMAAREADRPGVIGFELLNEPYRGTADADTWASTTLPAFYADMTTHVRAQAPDAMVFFDATGLDAISATTSLTRPDGENLVFAPHYYDPAVFAGADTFAADVTESLGRWKDLGDAWDVPVLLGEYGIQADREIAADYAREHEDALDALQMHGTWWEYTDAEERWNDEDLSLVAPDGTERTVLTAEVARPYPRAIAGDDATWVFEDGALELAYVSDGGVTEVRLPDRPGGWRAETSEGCAGGDARTFLFQADAAARVTLRFLAE